MSKLGRQLLRVVLGILLAVGVILALRLVGLAEFTQAIQRREWGSARLLALGLVVLGAALAAVLRLHPLVTGTSSLVLVALYGGPLVTQDFTLPWQGVPGRSVLQPPVVRTFSPTVFVVIGLLAAAALWGLSRMAATSPDREAEAVASPL